MLCKCFVFAGIVVRGGVGNDHVQSDDRLADFTRQMRVIHYAVVSPLNGNWNYALARVSSYKTSDNFTTLASKLKII